MSNTRTSEGIGSDRVDAPSTPVASDTRERAAIANLREYQRQLDADGVEVGVSREALNVVLGMLK